MRWIRECRDSACTSDGRWIMMHIPLCAIGNIYNSIQQYKKPTQFTLPQRSMKWKDEDSRAQVPFALQTLIYPFGGSFVMEESSRSDYEVHENLF